MGDIVVPDPYRWLEEDSSDQVAEWVAAQNAWTDTFLSGGRRQGVLFRIVELLRMEMATQPIARGGRYFFMRRSPDDAGMAIFVRDGRDGVDRRIIDIFAAGDTVPRRLGLLSVTRDGGVIAYSVQRADMQQAEVRFFDVDRRSDMALRLPPGRYTAAEILPDRSGVFFARIEEDGPRLWYRSLAAPAADDSLVFGAGLGADRAIAAAVSTNGRWLGIVVFHGDSVPATDVYLADLESGGPVRPLVEGVEATFLPTFAGDTMLLQTDWNAPNGRVLRVALEDPRRSRWVEIVAEREDAIIEGITAVGGRLLVNTLRDASSHLDAYDIDGAHLDAVELPFPGTISTISGGWAATEAFFNYTTFHVPPTIERYDAQTGAVTAWSEPHVPIPDGIRVELHRTTSADGTTVPIFLVFRDGLRPDNTNPTILTGFGGFGASLSPGFTVEAVMLAERGGIFAVAITRGGGERGDAWHEAAMRERKPRAIEDFMAVARWLIDENYTRPERLAAMGTTHGGLLVTAAMNRTPALFGAVAAQDALLDLTRIGQTEARTAWTREYGSPAEPDGLATILGYSPYQNVDSAASVPPVLLVAGRSSPVPPFHSRKMTARLQARATGGPYLLREDTLPAAAAGPRFMPVENLADILTFILGRIGRTPIPGPRS